MNVIWDKTTIRYTPMIHAKTNFERCIVSSPAILMEGALGERIKREFNISIDGVIAMAGLVFEESGRMALTSLWQEYIDISRKYHLPFIATTPTRRANQERVESAGYDKSIIYRNVEFLQMIKEISNIEMYVGGLLGCKGDAYTGEGALSTEEGKAFHSWQINLFRDSKVDFLYAGIMPCLAEAIGMAMAMSETDIPYIISFTIQEDGKLIDGHTIDFAISTIDNSVCNKPLGYMTNCIHPTIVHKALSHPFNQTETVRTRFIGIQGNTSALSYSELDGTHDLKESSPSDYANDTMKLVTDFKLQIVGGCCGTNGKHMEEIAKRIRNALSCDDILIFRTSVTTAQDIERIGVLFAQHPSIHKWSVDFEDWEKVLRIDRHGISVAEVIDALRTIDIDASELE